MEAIIAVTIITLFSPIWLLMAAVVWIRYDAAEALNFISALCISIYMLVCRIADK